MATRKTATRKKGAAETRDSVPKRSKKTKKATAVEELLQETRSADFASISIHEKVALLAYRYWEERGHQGGSPEEDWYRAEREILAGIAHYNS
ncbi:MAG: DUF2934 domain-containing protein [Acidobacteria bacterium]|nr:DUF2934 domain-containing protein [Acidobacteriota bacterium]